MSHGSAPPTTMPADASASRTSSLARLVSNCDNSSLAVALAGTVLLLDDAIQDEVDELGRGQPRAGEHPREAARDEAIRGARRPAGAVALDAACDLEQPIRAAVVLDQRILCEAQRVHARLAGDDRLGEHASRRHRG